MAGVTPNSIITKEITNFGGRLTRKINGDLNSGFAKFATSFGYDPFSKPDNLTWFPAVSAISGPTDLILDGKMRFESDNINYLYAIGNAGNLYKIQPVSTSNNNLNTSSVVGSVLSNSATYKFGASLEFYNSPSSVASQIYVGNDIQVNAINFDGSGDHRVGSGGYSSNTYRGLKKFFGKLFFVNGNTIGAIDSTGTVTSSVIGTGQGNYFSELNPTLPPDKYIHDIEVSIDGNYIEMASSGIAYEELNNISNALFGSNITEGNIWGKNTSDPTYTTTNSLGKSPIQAMESYLNSNIYFSSDTFGTSVSDGVNKLLTLPNNKPPLPNATSVNGNFLTWACVEKDPFNRLCASLYYFGALDAENPPGLYRIFRKISASPNFTYQVPFNTVVSSNAITLNQSKSSVVTASYGKHYISQLELSANPAQSSIFSLLQAPIAGDTVTAPGGGVYETQTQLFSEKIAIKAIRVYTEPTVTGNAFGVEMYGSNNTLMGSFSYAYAAGTDPTLLQGSLERIDFKPEVKSTYALSLLITNNGSTNMTIKKIEIDYTQSGK